ncbi:hypothetical protein QI271_10740 [Staphylococcus saprophyticus]|nr:hypothetical protein [Staphylococcus saprophyticus]MDW4045950.1 hypothetical protein [Staphylococcus saprophyticus]
MVKIKQKKTMNLPQLIEWAWENIDKVQGEIFISNVSDFFGNYSTVQFLVDGYGFKTDGVSHNDTFTVEVEEEITEGTVIDELVELYEDYLESNEILKHENRSISEAKDEDRCASQAFYIIHDDLTMTLIWTRERGLVE